MTEFTCYEEALRNVLESQLGLNHLKLDDNLIQLDPDLPTDEVLIDVFELLGYPRKKPVYSEWSGTLRDLIRIVDASIKAD